MAVASEPRAAEREKVIVAAITGATGRVEWLTNDRIEALAAGHGMLNIPVIVAADLIAEELLRGADITVRFANVRRQPVDDVLAKAIDVAGKAGAAPANAALIAATLLYLAGAQPQVGIPAGNRKLGATARMLAGVDRCGVAAVPTAKMNNKISGFPAVLALNQALLDGSLSPISGRAIPENVGGGPIYGHSALGEDVVFPGMVERGAKIATQAMLDALAGAGMPPHPFTAALFGAAAILEVIHPDADVADEYGPYGKVNSAFVAGKSAAETAGLPPALHVRLTGNEVETGRLIGDLGLILKDIGGPTVIGMMALDEIVAAFQEGIAGFSGGPLNPPLGHVCADAVVAMLALLENGATQESVAEALTGLRDTGSIDPEVALISMNTVARKAQQLRSGPVIETLLHASEPARAAALYRRAARAHDELAAGAQLADVVRRLDEERQETVEARAGAMFSSMLGKEVRVHVTRFEPGARRSSPLAARWVAFDANVDAEVTIDGETTALERFVHELVPAVARGERTDVASAVPLVAAVIDELYLAANTIVNVTVPAAVAAAMGLLEPAEAAETAERAAYVTAGIPGAKARAESAATLARRVMERAQR